MAEPYNKNLLEAIRMTNEMLLLAEQGDHDLNDSTCAIVYGVMRDMAYKLRRMAEEECRKHKEAGKWEEE